MTPEQMAWETLLQRVILRSEKTAQTYYLPLIKNGEPTERFEECDVGIDVVLAYLRTHVPGTEEITARVLKELHFYRKGKNVYVPDAPMIIESTTQARTYDVNLWEPCGIPLAPGKWPTLERWLDKYFSHLDNEAEARQRFYQWCKCLLFTRERSPVIPVLFGVSGAGKSSFAEVVLRRLLPPNAYAQWNVDDVLNPYTTTHFEKRLIHLEELSTTGTKKDQEIYDRLKQISTSDQALKNPKFQRAHMADILGMILVTSNATAPIEIKDDDRRVLMLKFQMEDKSKAAEWGEQELAPFFSNEDRLVAELSAFGYFLKEYEATNYRMMRAPTTEAKIAATHESQDSLELFLEAVKCEGLWEILHRNVLTRGVNFKNIYHYNKMEDLLFGKGYLPFDIFYELYQVETLETDPHAKLIPRGRFMSFVEHQLPQEFSKFIRYKSVRVGEKKFHRSLYQLSLYGMNSASEHFGRAPEAEAQELFTQARAEA